VRSIIDSNNYYDYLKALAGFVHKIGYAGLVVCLDEAAYLYKINNSVSRNNNCDPISRLSDGWSLSNNTHIIALPQMMFILSITSNRPRA
jgi:P-loop Domain of unknown function (DUF2791)